ncbi:MAG: HYR domain-containing protein [Verrucomicrobia bacterium]|nr:HYR domain-containing protein [Verrucomicrobiota bacterium]
MKTPNAKIHWFCLTSFAALVQLMFSASTVTATTAYYDLEVKVGYEFGGCSSSGQPGYCANPDCGFVVIKNNGPSQFVGELRLDGVSGFGQYGHQEVHDTSGPGCVLAPGASFRLEAGDESSNYGGFNKACNGPDNGLLLSIIGKSAGLDISYQVFDKDIHSGVFRDIHATPSLESGAPLLSDSYILQGGDPFGGDTGDDFEVSQTPATFHVQAACGDPCALICPGNITVCDNKGQCGPVVNFVGASLSGGCQGVTISRSPPSGSFFPVGTTTVNCTATDAAGNETHCSFTVTVIATASDGFIPEGVASVGLTHLVPDTILYNANPVPNLNDWEPYLSVLGTHTFLIGANTFAIPATDSPSGMLMQRFALAFQPVAGGSHRLGDFFFADDGTPYRSQINRSREHGDPGRVAGDKRPGALNFIVGGEASPHYYTSFQSDGRWALGFARSGLNARGDEPDPTEGRYGTIQIYSLDPTDLVQTMLCKAQDSANGRLASGTPPDAMITRFGGELAGLDNGNFVSVVHDRSGLRNPGDATVATIFAPDGSVVTESFVVENHDLWSNVAAYRCGFAVRVHENLYFFDNAGNRQGVANILNSGIDWDTGRGDGQRIGAHINSPYVCLAGAVNETDGFGNPIKVVRLGVWDSRTRAFVTQSRVSEMEVNTLDRVNLAVDALDRVCVVYEVEPGMSFLRYQVATRVFAFNSSSDTLTALTASFFPFVNYDPDGCHGIRTFRPSVAMTTRQICIAAKGEVNSANNPLAGPDTFPQTTFYTVISHPDPQNDPTTVSPTITCPADINLPCSLDLLVPVTFAATATDHCDPSPTIAYSQPSGSGFPVGTTTVTCTATGASGKSVCSFTVTRAVLGFAGFLPPIGGADATGGSFGNPVRTFKSGSTIPVKFTASCGGAPVLTGIHRLQAVKYSDATTAAAPIDATPQDAATTGNQFRLADSQWHFNLDTKAAGMTAGIWQLVATLSDGSQHHVWTQLK